jgi:hypothetical protein
MITIFNRKKILVEVSEIECARVEKVLNQAGIEKYCKVLRNKSVRSCKQDIMSQARYGFPYKSGETHVNYVYYIYVRRKDYKRAEQLI